jgi:hypothetical protein
VEQAYLNVATAMAAVGRQLRRRRQAHHLPGRLERRQAARRSARASRERRVRLGVDPIKPVTLIPVGALGEPDLLVEVDAVAVLP